ncbi:hypothetical protein SLS63_011246 [Diaporthe eres]|uniref:Trichodiene oxygenase n=1 Tax=Diaporthe eres TaxID=83184 RepID=A0ABR1NUK2_DIAER
MDWIEKTGDVGTKAFFGFLKVRNDPDQSHQTIVHAILDSNLPQAEKTVERIYDEVGTITGAAFETAAQSIRTILYYLYSDPTMLNRLRSELDQATKKQGNDGHLPLSTLEQLPFLTSVVREGLRLSPGLATRLARLAPDHDLFYDKWRIPAGTPVGMTVLLMHLNEDVYPQPKTFNPDRWSDEAKRSDKTFAPFSRGTRICLGMQ